MPHKRSQAMPFPCPTCGYHTSIAVKEIDSMTRSRQGLEHHFERFASRVSRWAGHSVAFFAAMVIVVAWAVSGPIFGFSNTWQLVINTGTTVLTFLMVFLIQNTMNRDSAALHLKLDELISATSQARDALIGAERLDEDQIQALETDVGTDQ